MMYDVNDNFIYTGWQESDELLCDFSFQTEGLKLHKIHFTNNF